MHHASMQHAPMQDAPMHQAHTTANPVATPGTDDVGRAAPELEGEEFVSPMVGSFYRAASPEAEPFCSVDDIVGEDTTICIIEAMKVMNEIKAEVNGRIVAILVENGEPVEFGQPLFRIQRG
jgi:acetyl-CoA carboxylase biotin carboxyl carrier protein